jgi:hypothetical protein
VSKDFRLSFFDPDFCRRVTRWSAAACVAWLLIELILLAVHTPQPDRCSNWTIYPGKQSETHVGWLILLMAVPTAWICFWAIRWRRFAEEVFNSILQRPELILDHNKLWLAVCSGWALICSVPLWVMLKNCTNVFESLGF